MRLDPIEQAMLAGQQGPAVQEAIAHQIRVGDFYGAEDFVAIDNAHMMGDIEVMGDSGLDYLRCTRGKGARCRVPITTNARCADFHHAESLGQDASEIAKEGEIISHLRGMNVVTTDTCINYQTIYQPHFGEHVAWGDTGTVIYANSVLGARTNFESGPAALAAALTGRTPRYGYHLDSNRRGTFRVIVDAVPTDLADWGALGKIIGEFRQSYNEVPVIEGLSRAPVADELKHLGCALASYGSMAMFHLPGVTPEASGGRSPWGQSPVPEPSLHITEKNLQSVYASYDLSDPRANLVVFSGPQLSLFELKLLAEKFAGHTVHPDCQVFITTASGPLQTAEQLGYIDILRRSGVRILEGVCFYILQNLSEMRRRNGWHNLVSNSAKLVNIIGAHRFNTILRRTDECVEAALTGRVPEARS